MKKQQYLDELKRHLGRLPAGEINDILADYREHFEAGIKAGKSEEQISEALGHPRVVGQSHLVTSLINEVNTTPSTLQRSGLLLRILLIFLVLTPFNFLVLMGPFLTLLALTVAGWSIPLAVGGVAVVALGVFFGAANGPLLGILPGLSLFFMFLGTLGFAAMGTIIMLVISRGFIQLVSSYIRWNINFIRARSA